MKGSWLILFVLLLVWAADTGAYAVGKLFGKHKLAPSVSPGKTWEGFFGGMVLAIIVAVIAAKLLNIQSRDTTLFLVCCVVTVIASVLGDLFESLTKREAGIKDSGTIFPGHGGMLDRIDSLIAAAPIFALATLLLDIH
jgi:phosphatidate cytidylyltransferase